VGFSGTANNLIVIRPGLTSGHNGRVIIDNSANQMLSGFSITAHDYIRIEKIEMRNVRYGVVMQGRSNNPSAVVRGIYIDSCRVTDYGTAADGCGVFVSGYPNNDYDNLDSIYIRWNYFEPNSSSMHQLDNIGAKSCRNIFIEGNTLLETNVVTFKHSDCVQFVWVENAVVNNNYMYSATNSIEHQNQIVMWEDLKGDFYIYNNVFYAPYYHTNMNNFFDKDNIYPHTFYFYSNTVIGQSTRHLTHMTTSDMHAKNNIFYNTEKSAGSSMDWNIPLDDWSEMDGNLYGPYQVGTIDGLSMSQLNSYGAELSGRPSKRYLVDPMFINLSGNPSGNNFGVKGGSPCKNAGVDLPPPFNTDINGTVRQPGQFTIGAYQYEE
jgi:hypothetical protein